MKAWYGLPFLIFLLGNATSVIGQNIIFQITVLSNPVITVNSATAYRSGLTVSHTTLRTYVKKNTPWSLSVQASGTNLTNGASAIPVGTITMQVTNATISNRPLVTLSATSQTIASDLSITAPDRTTDLLINYNLSGGTDLLKPSGTYGTTLTFTMSLL